MFYPATPEIRPFAHNLEKLARPFLDPELTGEQPHAFLISLIKSPANLKEAPNYEGTHMYWVVRLIVSGFADDNLTDEQLRYALYTSSGNQLREYKDALAKKVLGLNLRNGTAFGEKMNRMTEQEIDVKIGEIEKLQQDLLERATPTSQAERK